jgi:hypothetical protein
MILYILHDDLGIEPIYEGTDIDICNEVQKIFEAADYIVERTVLSVQ